MALPFSWARYLSTVPQEGLDTNGAEGQAALSWARQFDPNAHYTSGRYSTDGTHWEDSAATGSVLEYDNSKLPTNVTGGSGITNIARGTPGSGERLLDPRAVAQDPVYGPVTNWRNLQEKGPSMVDVLGPLLVGGATAFAGGFSLLGSLMTKLPNVASMFSNALSPQSISPQQIALMNAMRQQGGGP